MKAYWNVLRLADALNFRIRFGDELKYYVSREQKIMQLNPTVRELADLRYVSQMIAHEIGHYMVAPKSRRNRPDYGIPTGWASSGKSGLWMIEDSCASAVERYILRRSGMRKPDDNGDNKYWWMKSQQAKAIRKILDDKKLWYV